jgi:hypothetical protein
MNILWVMDFTILAKHCVITYKIMHMDFYLKIHLSNLCETLEY